MINLEAHQHFFQTGKTYSISWRKKQLRLLLKSINKNEKALYKAFKTDLHKGKFETLTSEIGLIKRSIRNTLKHLSEWTEPKRKKTPFLLFGRTSHTVYEPYGTVLIIGPFNYPFLSVMEPLIGAIAAGNTAVIKPSELTPNVSSVIETLIEATFPKHYVQAVTGGVETTEKLLSKDFDFIFFTGSPRVGKIVMEKASDHLTPVLLELGGKSPAIVGKDANVKLAAKRIVWGKLMNTGQTCIAPDYCLVHSSLKDSLVKKMIKEIKVLYGTDAQKSKDYGRIVSDKHADRLSKMIDGHQNDIIYGGGKNGQYIEPTLLELETAKGPAMEEEIFGPILPIIEYDNDEDIYNTVNQHPTPLVNYVFSKNKKKAQQIISKIPSGDALINDVILHAANENLPFGGVGNSGIGKFHGEYNIEAFSHEKSVMNTWFHGSNAFMKAPYTKTKYSLLKQLFK
jgi:aldehyde dehydrogenase (NAD+)